MLMTYLAPVFGQTKSRVDAGWSPRVPQGRQTGMGLMMTTQLTEGASGIGLRSGANCPRGRVAGMSHAAAVLGRMSRLHGAACSMQTITNAAMYGSKKGRTTATTDRSEIMTNALPMVTPIDTDFKPVISKTNTSWISDPWQYCCVLYP